MSYLCAYYAALLAGSVSAPSAPVTLAPAPGWGWRTETEAVMPAGKQLVTVPGLAACTTATIFLVFSKAASAEDIHMLCSLPTADGLEVDLIYAGRTYGGGYFGYGYNGYDNGFITSDPLSYLDNEVVRLTRTTIQNNTRGGAYAAWYNSVKQGVSPRAGAAYPPRPFTDKFMLGGDFLSGLDWVGRVLACYVYPSLLSEAEAQQTEDYLRAKYPTIS